MKRPLSFLMVGLLLTSVLAGCATPPTPEQIIVKETVEVPVEVTRVVQETREMPAATQEWELLNPEGVVIVEPLVPNPHPDTLEGKTVVLKWSNKPNGDIFLNRIAELLIENIQDVQVIKSWEVDQSTRGWSASKKKSAAMAEAIAAMEPDLVIGAQGD